MAGDLRHDLHRTAGDLNMLPVSRPRLILLVWLAFLGAPLAWSLSLGAMFWLTHPVCQGMTRMSMLVAGSICALIAVCAGVLASYTLHRLNARLPQPDGETFLLRLALGGSAIFTLVILLSMVPVAMLTPCPV
jgi:hypothetical protein